MSVKSHFMAKKSRLFSNLSNLKSNLKIDTDFFDIQYIVKKAVSDLGRTNKFMLSEQDCLAPFVAI